MLDNNVIQSTQPAQKIRKLLKEKRLIKAKKKLFSRQVMDQWLTSQFLKCLELL